MVKKIRIYRRLSKNATDTASTESLILEFLEKKELCNDDILLIVQATSPFTTSFHFSDALRKYEIDNYDSMLSVVRFKRFLWGDSGAPINYDYHNRPRRQKYKGCLLENGAFYINKVANIIKYKNRLCGNIGYYLMPEYTWLEIDEEDDWIFAEKIMKKYRLDGETKTEEIKIVFSDVDGCLTDAGMYYSENGEELKKFSTYDGMAVELLKNKGIRTGIITGEKTELVKRRAEKIKCNYLYIGIQNKLKIIKEICNNENVNMENVAYLGDDINDIQVLKAVGHPFCPINARNDIKRIPGIIILKSAGGDGAFREMAERIITSLSGEDYEY